jgi:hypothetical protein
LKNWLRRLFGVGDHAASTAPAPAPPSSPVERQPDELTELRQAPIPADRNVLKSRHAPDPPAVAGDSAAEPVSEPPSRQAAASPSRADSDATVVASSDPSEAAPEVAELIAVYGELKGERFPVVRGENRLGRSTDCAIQLASPFISRVHAAITWSPEGLHLSRISDKKTLVNGEPPGDAPLNDGDTIELGRTVFRLRLFD